MRKYRDGMAEVETTRKRFSILEVGMLAGEAFEGGSSGKMDDGEFRRKVREVVRAYDSSECERYMKDLLELTQTAEGRAVGNEGLGDSGNNMAAESYAKFEEAMSGIRMGLVISCSDVLGPLSQVNVGAFELEDYHHRISEAVRKRV